MTLPLSMLAAAQHAAAAERMAAARELPGVEGRRLLLVEGPDGDSSLAGVDDDSTGVLSSWWNASDARLER